MTAWATPSGNDNVEVAETSPIAEARLLVGRDLYAHASALFQEEDYLGAVRAWEQVLLLMPEKEPELRVQLAHAYSRAYAEDQDASHLDKAAELLRTQLTEVAPANPARTELESSLQSIERELDAIRKAEEQDRREREAQIRQEQILLNQQALAEAKAESARFQRRLYSGVGGTLVGLGGGAFAAMTVFLVRGENFDKQGEELASMTGVSESSYHELLKKGKVQNRAAIATGLLGGAAIAAGVGLLVTKAGHSYRASDKHEKKYSLRPTLGGLQLGF